MTLNQDTLTLGEKQARSRGQRIPQLDAGETHLARSASALRIASIFPLTMLRAGRLSVILSFPSVSALSSPFSALHVGPTCCPLPSHDVSWERGAGRSGGADEGLFLVGGDGVVVGRGSYVPSPSKRLIFPACPPRGGPVLLLGADIGRAGVRGPPPRGDDAGIVKTRLKRHAPSFAKTCYGCARTMCLCCVVLASSRQLSSHFSEPTMDLKPGKLVRLARKPKHFKAT